MAKKIKDTDYLVISARIKAMESGLLTRERMEQILDARSDEEVQKILQDCGYPELDELNMWRGFAVKKGTPAEMTEWFQKLVDQVTADEEWQKFFADSSIVVFNKTTEEFEAIIKDNIADYIDILKSLELIDASYEG